MQPCSNPKCVREGAVQTGLNRPITVADNDVIVIGDSAGRTKCSKMWQTLQFSLGMAFSCRILVKIICVVFCERAMSSKIKKITHVHGISPVSPTCIIVCMFSRCRTANATVVVPLGYRYSHWVQWL